MITIGKNCLLRRYSKYEARTKKAASNLALEKKSLPNPDIEFVVNKINLYFITASLNSKKKLKNYSLTFKKVW